MSKFETNSETISDAPAIAFTFDGDTVSAELCGAKLYGEAEGGERTRLRLTAASEEVLADVTMHPRAHRGTTENVQHVGSALLWSHWRYLQALKNTEPGAGA